MNVKDMSRSRTDKVTLSEEVSRVVGDKEWLPRGQPQEVPGSGETGVGHLRGPRKVSWLLQVWEGRL